MKTSFIRPMVLAALAILLACSTEESTLTSTAYGKEAPLTNADLPAIRKLVKEDFGQGLGEAVQNPARLLAIVTDDFRLRWPNKVTNGKAAFVQAIQESFQTDFGLFVIAVNNYKFLVTQCGVKDEALRPVGLPASVDIRSFDPAAITPEVMQKHPGLSFPWIEFVKDLPGQQLAAGRYLVLAKFKHSWQKSSDQPYWYVDRFTVRRDRDQLKIAEYEFTADFDDMARHPTPITKCP